MVNLDKITTTVIDKLDLLEKQLEKETFFFAGTSYWPALRYILWMYCSKATSGDAYYQQYIAFNHAVSPFWRARYWLDKNLQAVSCLETQPVNILFVTPESPSYLFKRSNQNSKPSFFDPILDPLIRNLENEYEVKKICLVGRNNSKSDRLHEIPVKRLLVPYLKQIFSPHGFHQAQLVQIKKACNILGINVSPKLIERSLNRYFNLVHTWKKVLLRYTPELVFYTTYGQHMPLVEAANELDIETVDIQHGVIRNISPIYSRWHNVPRKGWPATPKNMLCWTKYDSDFIRRTFNGAILPFTIGYPYLTPCLAKNNKSHSIIPADRLIGLISLQEQISFPNLLSEVIRCNTAIHWLIKDHPKWGRLNTATLPKLKNFTFYAKGTDQVDFDYLLSKSSVHISRDSSTVYQSVEAGIPTYVYGSSGKMAYSEEIANGEIRLLTSARKLDIRPLKHKYPSHQTQNNTINDIVKNLLNNRK